MAEAPLFSKVCISKNGNQAPELLGIITAPQVPVGGVNIYESCCRYLASSINRT
jgi:hypothetical protein